MSASAEYRKLAAIMFTDMVGYSALVERDEAVALQLLEEHRRLLRSIFPKHDGFEIKTIGDGFLLEFSSALAAVQCAIEIQEAIARRNSANPPHGNFQLRVGIHAGDVVRRADDVIGDGVNIAARIVPLAVEGGICISRQVFEQVENRLASSPKKMGQVKVKNMTRPLEVYWVGYEGAADEPPDLVQADIVSTQKSIAVLPFVSMSSDPENEYLSDGLTEDLIMAFSRLKGLRVPARTSSFAFKGKNEDVRRIGQQLNVTKILEGSVRKAGERVRITAQLINAADGDHMWAQTFDRQLQDVFAIQDEITRAIVRELEMQLIGAGDQSVTQHGTYNTEAYQLYLQGRYHFYKFTGEGFRRCIECCKRALEIDPNYALAYAVSSLSYQTGWYYGFLSFEEKLAAIGPHDLFAEKAVELDPDLAETQTALGIVKCWNLRDWSGGEECFKRAIELNPNYVTAHEHYAGFLACMRRTDEALTHARLALQIDPLSPMINLHAGFIYWLLHRYDLVLEQAERLLELESNFFGTYWLLGWAHWCQGKRDAAIADLRRAVTLGGGPIQIADLGCLLGRLGRKAEAQRVLEELKEMGKRTYVQPAYIGFLHASLGDHDEAFACFAQGMEHENLSVALIREYCIGAGLDDLRADSRFPELLKKIGLEERSRDETTGLGIAETVVKEQLDNSAMATGQSTQKCPRCGAVTRNDQKTCINCLLQEGLETKGEASRETFESILVEANVTDTPWRLGHYEILEEIGRGGMGVIYRARQQHSRRTVAVKRILAHQVDSHETLVRFRREAEAVASLDHPNILPIYEVSESEEGLPFFSMKYATGGSLRTVAPKLRENPRECVRVMAKVARAIAYAHGKGVLHRDLQPGNILLDENGEPMVSDFGLAKWLNETSDLTRTLETLGTPGYIAPEQAECRAADLTRAADIYSLGAILFYLLTGRPPFVGPNVLHVIHQAAATPAPRLRSLIPSTDRNLETIVARCLESDPKARYQSAGALADDLEHWLRHEPIQARRSGVFTRVGKWVRRNRTTTMLIAALVVLAAAIVGMMVLKNESPHALASLPAGIAVLPLQNLSEEKENAYFADGIQDELLTNLSKIRDLKVISRTSVMHYKSGITRNLKDIAQQLGVSNVVEGSVRRSGNHVRVSVQLIDAKTNRHLWAQNYDRTLADSVALQGDLATEIAAAVGGTLSPQEKARVQAKPTENAAAYDAYLRGRAFAARSYQKSYEDNAIQSYQEAVRLDPGFALAWARLSIAVGHNPWDPSPAQLASVKDAADHALALDPDLPETHLAFGYYRYGQHDYTGALAEFQQAEQGLPNNAEVIEAIALVQRRLGHWEEAITGLRRTIELDPRYHDAYENLAGTYRWLRRFPETLATVDQLLAWEPNDPIALGRKAAAFWAMGDLHAVEPLLTNPGFDSYDRGVQALFQRRYATAIEIFSAPPPSNLAPSPSTSERQLFLGLSQQRDGDVAAARVTYQKAVQDFQRDLEKVVPGSWAEAWLRTCLGRAYAGLGEAASAIAEGEKAMAIDPTSKNPVDGPVREEKMANIYALLGDADHAIPILKRLLRTTYAGAITPALLRLDPVWDQIRDDPRFQELTAEGKPIPEKGIAVLPFQNLSADPQNAFFADGVQDEILNDLAKIADLKVISRTSVMQYKSSEKRNLRQIANELGVTHVVEGSVQRAANRVRVSAQLIDAKTDTHLWANSYDRPLDDVFAIQTDIAKAIAGQLQAKLSPAEKSAIEQPPTTNLIAYDCYLRAEKLWAQQTTQIAKDLREIVRLLDEAVGHDPTFLLAYCELARTHAYISLLGVDPTPVRVTLAKEARDTALRLGPDRGEPHLAAAYVAYWCYRDYDTAVTELRIARRALPNNAEVLEVTAAIARRQGHWEECIRNFERAIELDPRNLSIVGGAGLTYEYERRFAEAAAYRGRAAAVAPDEPTARVASALVDLQSRADTQPVREAIQSVLTKNPSAVDRIAGYWFYVSFCRRDAAEMVSALASLPSEGMIPGVAGIVAMPRSFLEGLAALARNDAPGAEKAFTAARAEMEKIVREQPDYAQGLCGLGMIDAALGRKEDALREVRHAVELLPVTKDAMAGAELLTNLAITYAWAGEKELAIKQLEEVLRIPSEVCYGRLRLEPYWDPLRGDPRFEQLVEESKKPVALESLQPVPSGIAVLPFENLSADPENAFFADGVQDEVLNDLAKIADLKVISRTSVMQYRSGAKRNLRQIANELGVAHVVEGSVQRAGNRVRVSAQLIDAKSDTHLWAERYDRPLDDVFAIQTDIAKAIAGQLQAKLSPSQSSALATAPTHDMEAYNLFLRGESTDWQSPDRAAAFYRQALARDPNFALAYARLAYSRLQRHWYISPLTAVQLAEVKSNIDRALTLSPDSPDSHLAAAEFYYRGHRDYDSALRELDRTIELQPNNARAIFWRGVIYRRRGEWRRSLAEFERAAELNPRDSSSYAEVGCNLLEIRRWSDAEHALTHALALDPRNTLAALYLANTYINSTGDVRRARQAWEEVPADKKMPIGTFGASIAAMIEGRVYLDVLERHFADALKAWDIAPTNIPDADARLRKLEARVGIQVLAGQNAAARPECEQTRALLEAQVAERAAEDRTALTALAWVYVCLGHNADALRVARQAADSLPIERDALSGPALLVGLAQIEAHTGRAEEAIKILRQLLVFPAGVEISIARLKIDPVWDPIRNDPGFQKLLSEPEPETVYN